LFFRMTWLLEELGPLRRCRPPSTGSRAFAPAVLSPAVPVVSFWPLRWRPLPHAPDPFTTVFRRPWNGLSEVRRAETAWAAHNLNFLPIRRHRAILRFALAEIPPGPAWLRDIAMVDYDYLSDGGQGWFRDIDALEAAIPAADRGKVLLALHGWYDFVGRYCFSPETGALDRGTAFSNFLT
jgi:hypothetical protein